MQVAIAEAKAQFAELIRRAESGEDIVVTRHGRAVARITPANPAPSIALIGALKGKIEIAPDFDELPEGFQDAIDAPIEPI